MTVGGMRRTSAQTVKLKQPVSVSFSPTGELAVLDTGTRPHPTLLLLDRRYVSLRGITLYSIQLMLISL